MIYYHGPTPATGLTAREPDDIFKRVCQRVCYLRGRVGICNFSQGTVILPLHDAVTTTTGLNVSNYASNAPILKTKMLLIHAVQVYYIVA